MSTKKNAPPKKGQQGTGRSTGKSNRNTANDNSKSDKEKPPEGLSKIAEEIKKAGGIGAVLEMLRTNQTRTGPGMEKTQKSGAVGIIQGSFGSIAHSLELKEDRIRSIKSRLTDMGYYDEGAKLNGKDESNAPYGELISLTSKAEYFDKTLMKHNDQLMCIIEHLDHLFSPSH